MIIYEKDNKLNIKFDNKVNEDPDLQISKEDGKTSVTVDGQQGAGGANVLTLYVTYDEVAEVYIAYKDSSRTQTYETYEEAENAVKNADIIKVISDDNPEVIYFGSSVLCTSTLGEQVFVKFGESFDIAFLFSVPPESLDPVTPAPGFDS